MCIRDSFNRGQRYETAPAETMITKYVALANKFNMHPVTPVSYTHLDVYKRQPWTNKRIRARNPAKADCN